MTEGNSASLTFVIRLTNRLLRGLIDDAVRSNVEETLNALQRGSGPDSAVHNGTSVGGSPAYAGRALRAQARDESP
jgi:hypothetical protein